MCINAAKHLICGNATHFFIAVDTVNVLILLWCFRFGLEINALHIFFSFNRPAMHRERRKFLRSALRDLTLIYAEEPGLLGPKVIYV